MQMSRNVVFHNFIPSSPLSTNVKLKGRPAPRLCQIKPISCCLKKKIKKIAGKQKTAEIHISHWASTSFSLSPLPSFHLFPFLSVHSANGGYVKANSGSLSIKDFMCPIKKKKATGCPLESEVSFPCLIMSVWQNCNANFLTYIATDSSHFHSLGDHLCARVILRGLSLSGVE